jgi:Rps23 Pro-64 3,4-dihydroxylase Tpa1-like proline 4-hydroxylase
MEISQPTEVTASLEGKKIKVAAGTCTLFEYDFMHDVWNDVDSLPWPLTLNQARFWLAGWNQVDRFSAVNKLIGPSPE